MSKLVAVKVEVNELTLEEVKKEFLHEVHNSRCKAITPTGKAR